MKVQVEYIWMDGSSNLRSKTKIVDIETDTIVKPTDFPDWGFDGSSTFQAEGHDSDLVLKPVAFVRDPIRSFPNFLVLCEVFDANGHPHKTNTRAELRQVLEAGAASVEPWFGIEQEYTLFKGSRPLGFPESGYPAPQGAYYCGVGAGAVVGRPLIEAHTKACIQAGLLIAGVNFEVLLGQAEFQIGHGDPLTVADHLWIARWLLHRIGEEHDVSISFLPKPVLGDWNGSGLHTNFSTRAMRVNLIESINEPGSTGLTAIYEACEKMAPRVPEHIAVYGVDNHLRLTGKHETCDINTFRYGVADRGASIRIPRHVANMGYGYLEDRRPAANADPYQICTIILKTVCDI